MALAVALDIILAILILLGAIIGIKKGFVKSVLKPLRFIGSLAIAYSLSNLVSTKLVEPLINAPLTNQIEAFVSAKLSASPDAELPTLVKLAATLANVDLEGKTAADIISSVSSPLVHVVCIIITFILLYLIAKMVLTILFKLLDVIFDSTLLVLPNKILGFVLNTLVASVIAWILVAIFGFVISLPAVYENAWAAEFIGGPIYRFFSGISPLELLLSF